MTISDKKAIPHPSFAQMLTVFTKIGFLSFGGPAGQIALMHTMLVEEKRWISDTRFLHALNYCMLLPGPEAQQLAIYSGWLLHGLRGGIVAGSLFVIPGFIVIMALSTLYALFSTTFWLGAVFYGLKAAVLAIVFDAVLRVGKRTLKNSGLMGMAIGSFIAIFALHVPFPMLIIVAGLIGFFGTRARPEFFASKGHGANASDKPVLILPEPSVSTGWRRAIKVMLVGCAVWVLPVLVLSAIFGFETIFTPIALFFSKMAVVTFGGAYAALAYVAQEAVAKLHWLSPQEMLDGLGLAETTPGPLILVLTYVGFLAGFRAPPAGLDSLTSAMIGATLTTWVTFVPCFIWIFLGAPYVEKLRSNVALSGALTAITAAIVGVLANLALWFALNTTFSQMSEWQIGWIKLSLPLWHSFDVYAALIALIAGVMLMRFKFSVIYTIALCAGLGIGVKVLGF